MKMSRSTTFSSRVVHPLYGIGLATIAALALAQDRGPIAAEVHAAPAQAQALTDLQQEAVGDIKDATAALERVGSARPIPRAILSSAVAVGVFDNLVKAAFIVGGTGGDGVISRHRPTGWTAPAFFRMGGASIGLQIGGAKTDVVLVFMNKKSLDALLKNRLEIGVEISAVAGPATATGPVESLHDILVYTQQEGLFAGAALNGAIITPNDDQNRAAYDATAKEILSGTARPRLLPGADEFVATLAKAAQS